jgi:hypothetical protein
MPFIPKDDQRLPDHYGIEISYIDGKVAAFEIASHRLGDKVLEFVTKDDFWNWVPLTAVKRVEFDKRFSAIIALKENKNGEDSKKE